MFSATRPAKVGKWTEPALRVLRERYLARRGDEVLETPEEMCWRVAQCLAQAEARWGKSPGAVQEVATAFYELMVDGYFLPNSPTLMNAGKGNQLQYSACYVLPVGDSMEEIFDAVKAAAIIHKCLVGDTFVMCDGLVRLSEVPDGVPVMTDEGPFHVVDVHDNGEQPVFEVRTNRGYRITGTAEHRLLVVAADGRYCWRTIGELREGDWLVMKPGSWIGGRTKLPEFAFRQKQGGNRTSFKAQEHELPRELTPGLAELIGLYIGDGSNHRDGIRFTVGADSADVIRRIEDLSRSLFGKAPSVSRTGSNAFEVSILSVQVKEWFGFVGISKTSSREARIPEIILRTTEDVACGFLRGLFTADGCVRTNGHITLTTSSRRLGEELQLVLFALGVPTHLRRDVSKSGYESWQLSVCSRAGFQTFREKIGFLSERKAARLAAVNETEIFTKGETIPNQRGRLRVWYDGLPASVRRQAKRQFDDLLNRVSAPRELSRQRLAAALSTSAPVPQFFAELAAEDFFFVRVRAVEAKGVRRVWDLTVPERHAYLANGFVAHNSGGGTGFAFSRLRPKDDTVASTGGKASGPVSFLRVFNGATEAVKQGGTRRGANMGILQVDHPDILEFIECKLDGGITNFNISVAATNRFMEALARGEEYKLINPRAGTPVGTLSAREVFNRIVSAAWRTGDPGMVFIDRINRSPANPTPEVGMVEATNPCVAGDALIYTACGLIRADALSQSDEAADVTLDSRFDAGDWGLASTVFQTGVKPVYRLVTEEGYELRLTADHQLMTPEGWRKADSLRPGDLIHILNRKGGFGTEGTLEEGRLVGWLIGDGHIRPDKGVILRFYGDEKRELAPVLAEHMNAVIGGGDEDRYRITAVEVTGRDQATVSSVRFARRILERYHLSQETKLSGVPAGIFVGSEDLQRGFLQGLFTADGHISGTREKGVSVRLTSISLPLLKDVQRMLLNFGVVSRLYANRHQARTASLPDGKGGTAEYECQPDHDLVISRASLVTFAREIGFLTEAKQNRLLQAIGAYSRGPYRETFVVRFKALEPDGVEPVFDLKEPFTHSFVSNGFVVHNCGEQPLLPNEACNLGSINVSKFAKQAPNGEWTVDWDELERVVRLSVRFLDDVIEMNPYPLPEIDATVKSNRRIGLGVMGWADLLFIMRIPYDSQEALDLADQLMTFIGEKGHDQSAKLAEERGPFPNWSKSIYKSDRPLRNSTVTTIAPTGTISMIAGCSSGIEPIFALAFEHRVKQPDGERVLTFVNETFDRIAREQGFYSEALMQEVARRGSLHGIPGVPDWGQRVFKTAHEIPYEWHVRHQAAFQKHTDNGVSKCVTGDTLIFTNQGLLRIQDLYRGEAADAFSPIQLKVADWAGPAGADLFYFGGKRDVIALETDLGFSLRATPNHRVRVMADGEIVWRRMDEIKVGDFLVVPYGFDVYGHMHDFKAIYGDYYRPAERTNANRLRWPNKITTDLARLLGYLIADGGFSENQVIFTQKDGGVLEDYRRLVQQRFGVEPRVSVDLRRENLKQAVVNSRDLIAFFSDYLGTGDRADTKHTPRCILASGPEVMKEYVRGLTLDGYVNEQGRLVVLGTVSRRLAEEVQAILLSLGIVTRMETKGIHYEYCHDENRKNTCYEVVVLSKFRRAFLERIGFAEDRKNVLARAQLQQQRHPDTHYVIPGVRPQAVSLARTKMAASSSKKLRDYLHSFITADAEVTEETIKWLLDITQELRETSEWKTLAGLVNRKAMYTPVTKLWTDKEEVFDLQVPSTHSFITNGLISHNTINLPHSATEQDIADAYLMAWELGCLGITVFRDGCKGDQVLNVGVKGKREALAPEPAAGPTVIKPRPHSLTGHTYRMETPIGTAFVTVNGTTDNEPFEVFVSVGKAGSDTMAVAEALGRLISLVLRLPSPLSPRRRLEEVIGQLSRIGGGQPTGFGPAKVLSLPDALARVLAEHIGQAKPPDVDPMANGPKRIGDLCKECGQATFIYEEGCKKCLSCGYNEC